MAKTNATYDDDEIKGNIAPKKGLPWLRDKLAERKGASQPGDGDGSVWRQATGERHHFRAFEARLVTKPKPDTRTEIQRRADELHDARQAHLSENLVTDLLSVRVRARDMRHKGRVVETWIRGVTLRRVIERAKPTREGVSHDRYSVLAAWLMQNGLTEQDGRHGYRWTREYTSVRKRAEWVVAVLRRDGEMRRLPGPKRYQMLE